MKTTIAIVIITILSAMSLACSGGKTELVLGATTTVQDPGLLDELVADFEKDAGYKVKPIVQGSGQILTLARQGELDVVMTHSPTDEKKLVDDGFTTSYQQYMENFFEIVGPAGDPAGVASASSTTDAFKRIAATGNNFISRGIPPSGGGRVRS